MSYDSNNKVLEKAHDSSSETELQVLDPEEYVQNVDPSLAGSSKTFLGKLFPVMACGAGLFSDGYINNVQCLHPKAHLHC